MAEPGARRLGFGVDYQYRSRYPGGLDGLVAAYADRLSHLSVVGLPDTAAARELRARLPHAPFIHHLSNIAPADPRGPDLERLRHQDRISRELDAVWCGEDIGIWSLGPFALPYFAPPPFDPVVAEFVAEGIAEVMRGSSVPFLAEIPSVSFAAGTMSLEAFFGRLVEVSGCGLVLDLSHVFSYALATDRDPAEVLLGLPLEHVWEIHVAGGRVHERHPFRYIDSHSDAIEPTVLELLERSLPRCPRLRAVTFEIGVGLPRPLIDAEHDRLAALLDRADFRPRLTSSSS